MVKPAEVVLETSRLWLRRIRGDDLEAMFAVFGDPVAMEHYPAPWTREDLAAGIARVQRRYEEDGYGLWLAVRKDTGEAIGDCGLMKQDLPGGPEVEVGYHFRRDQWGHGYATEAARGCMKHGFQTTGAGRLISLIRPANIPSRRVAERNGMRVTEQIVWRELPHLVYAITQTEWRQQFADPRFTALISPPRW